MALASTVWYINIVILSIKIKIVNSMSIFEYKIIITFRKSLLKLYNEKFNPNYRDIDDDVAEECDRLYPNASYVNADCG
jgi:hypothetical protein